MPAEPESNSNVAAAANDAAKPRFVILSHRFEANGVAASSREDHFDLMLEHGGRLLTWALPHLPAAGETVTAKALPDHRLAYLDYEGPISGDRGAVTRVESGTFGWIKSESATAQQRTLRLHTQREVWTLRLEQVDASEVTVTRVNDASPS